MLDLQPYTVFVLIKLNGHKKKDPLQYFQHLILICLI